MMIVVMKNDHNRHYLRCITVVLVVAIVFLVNDRCGVVCVTSDASISTTNIDLYFWRNSSSNRIRRKRHSTTFSSSKSVSQQKLLPSNIDGSLLRTRAATATKTIGKRQPNGNVRRKQQSFVKQSQQKSKNESNSRSLQESTSTATVPVVQQEEDSDTYLRIQIQPFTMYLYPVSIQLSIDDSYILLSTMENIIYNYIHSTVILSNDTSSTTGSTTGGSSTRSIMLDTVRLGNIQTGVVPVGENITVVTTNSSSSSSVVLLASREEESPDDNSQATTSYLHVEKGKISLYRLSDSSTSRSTISSYQVNIWVQEALQKSDILTLLHEHQQEQQQQMQQGEVDNEDDEEEEEEKAKTNDSFTLLDIASVQEIYFSFANITSLIDDNNDTVTNNEGNPTSPITPTTTTTTTTSTTTGQDSKASQTSINRFVIVGIVLGGIIISSFVALFALQQRRRRQQRESNLQKDVNERVMKLQKSLTDDTMDGGGCDITSDKSNPSSTGKSNGSSKGKKHSKQQQQQKKELQLPPIYGNDTQPDTPENIVTTNASILDSNERSLLLLNETEYTSDIVDNEGGTVDERQQQQQQPKKNPLIAIIKATTTTTSPVRRNVVKFDDSNTSASVQHHQQEENTNNNQYQKQKQQQQQQQQQSHPFRASPTPSSWCGSESEWSVSTETNDTKILKSIHNLGHAYDGNIEHQLQQHKSQSSESFNRLINSGSANNEDTEMDTNSTPTILAQRLSDTNNSNNTTTITNERRVVTPGSNDDTFASLASASTSATASASTSKVRLMIPRSLSKKYNNNKNKNKIPVSRAESFEMDRQVTIQKDMLANSWAGTFHKRPTTTTTSTSNLNTAIVSPSTPHSDNDNDDCSTAPLLANTTSTTGNDNTQHLVSNDGNRINDTNILSSSSATIINNNTRKKNSIMKSKKVSTSTNQSSMANTSVLQPNHFTVKGERIARQLISKKQQQQDNHQNDINLRLLAHMGICTDDNDNNSNNNNINININNNNNRSSTNNNPNKINDDFDNNNNDDTNVLTELKPWGTSNSNNNNNNIIYSDDSDDANTDIDFNNYTDDNYIDVIETDYNDDSTNSAATAATAKKRLFTEDVSNC